MNKLLILLFFIPLSSYGQNWEWINYLEGSNSNHYFFDIELSNDQQYLYGTGRYRAPGTFYGQNGNIGPLPYAGSRDVFVAKMDIDGNFIWAISEGGNQSEYSQGIAVDEFENIYITGNTYGNSTFSGTYIPSGQGTIAFLAKYDSMGILLWIKTWDGNGNDYAVNAESDKNGHIYISGEYTSGFSIDSDTLQDDGSFLMKLDTAGTVIWCTTPTNVSTYSSSKFHNLKLIDNDLFVTGEYEHSVQFGSQTYNNGNWANAFFSKLDTSGIFQWTRVASGSRYSAAKDLILTDTNIFVVGTYAQTTTFDTVTKTSSSNGTSSQDHFNSADAFLAKYNVDGSSCLWVKDVKSTEQDVHTSILQQKNGEILVTGAYFQDNIYSATGSTGELRIYSFSSDGSSIDTISPVGQYTASGTQLKTDSIGNIYFCGHIKGEHIFNNQITITPSSVGFTTLVSKLLPKINIPANYITFCANDSIYLEIENCYGSPLQYQWYINGILSNIDTLKEANFSTSSVDSIYCIVSNSHQVDTAIFYLNEHPIPSNFLPPDTTICTASNFYTINAVPTFNHYNWSTGVVGSTSSITVAQSDSIWLTVTDTNNCVGTDSITISLFDNSGLDFTLGTDTNYCGLDSINLTGPIGNYNYYWNTANTNQSIFAHNSGTYALTITDSNACTFTDTIQIQLFEDSHLDFTLGPDTNICDYNTINLYGPIGNFDYIWNTSETTSSISISNSGIYTLNIVDSNFCSNTDTISVYFIDCVGLNEYIYDDLFSIIGESIYIHSTNEVSLITLRIYSIDGQLIDLVKNQEYYDISYLPQGLYIATASQNHKNYQESKKFLRF